MSVKLLTEHYLEFLSLKGGYRGSSESTRVKIPYCWKSHVAAQMIIHHWQILQITDILVIFFYHECCDSLDLSFVRLGSHSC